MAGTNKIHLRAPQDYKWVRESVVTAVLLFIALCGHLMFLLLTLPVFANKNFPYHVRTTQIGIMEVTGNAAIDNFGQNPYQPSAGAAQTVIIPLTRRTEELIGSMYSQYMATAPPAMLDNNISPTINGKSPPNNIPNLNLPSNLNGASKTTNAISRNIMKPKLDGNMQGVSQESSDTNNSDDIKPIVRNGVFTVENEMADITARNNSPENSFSSEEGKNEISSKDLSNISLPPINTRKTILAPITRDPPEAPAWSLAKGPSVIAMLPKKPANEEETEDETDMQTTKKVPTVRNGLPSSGEISTILEGRVQNYSNNVSDATLDLFSAGCKRM